MNLCRSHRSFAAMAPGAPLLHLFLPIPTAGMIHTPTCCSEYTLTDGDVEAAENCPGGRRGCQKASITPRGTPICSRSRRRLRFADGCIEVICRVSGCMKLEQIAHALGLPQEQIVVRHGAVGGAFGGREDISIQIVLALAA